MTDKSCVAYLEQYYMWNDYDNNHAVKDHFYNGKALYLCDLISAVGSEKMADVTFNYGVVPTPKYDEDQEHYVDGVDPYRFYSVSIPKVADIDLDKTTFVLEAMAYLSEKDVTPVYYELTLKNKRFGANDDDAPKMLDIIFQNRCVDLSVIFNWNDCIQYYNQLLTDNQGVLSFMESKGAGMQDRDGRMYSGNARIHQRIIRNYKTTKWAAALRLPIFLRIGYFKSIVAQME